MRILIIIPTYNEAKEIKEIITGVKKFVSDILIVDDGSTDNTMDIAKENGAFVLKNASNRGKGASLSRGFDYALKNGFDVVIAMDGDGQHSPEDVPLFIRSAGDSGAAIIIGNRMDKAENMPRLRFYTNKFMSWLISLVCRQHIPDTQCGFRLIKRKVLEKVNLRTNKFEIESELLIKASRLGFKIDSVPITTIYRGEKSKMNPFIDTLRFIKFILRELWISKS